MRRLALHFGRFVISAALLALSTQAAAYAGQRDRFAYSFKMTAEEGPRDPAVEKRYSSQFAACQKQAMTTLANSACFTIEFARQDKALNRAWKVTLGHMPAGLRKPLLNAQRQWVASRDPFCRTQSAKFSGGTIAPLIYVDCRVEQTIRRTIWLEQLR